MSTTVLLGVDLGTSGCKVGAFDPSGRCVGSVRESLPLHCPGPGQAEQSVEDWWGAVARGIRELVTRCGAAGCRIAGVGVCGQWPSLVLLDEGGLPLRPAMIWKDTRGQLSPGVPAAELAERIGLPRAYVPSLPLAKLLWLRQHEADHLSSGRLRWCLGAKDAIVYRLTGQATTDPVEAWWSGLAARHGVDWDPDLVDLAGIQAGCLPKIRPKTSLAGHVGHRAAIVTGLQPGTPVAVGTVDGVCGALGGGLLAPGPGVVIRGSSLIVATLAPQDVRLPAEAAIMDFPPLAGPYGLLYTSTPSGSADHWLSGLLGSRELKLARRRAWALPPNTHYPLFLPHLEGMTSPEFGPGGGGWLGLAADHGWPELVRAIEEGIAFSLRHILEALEGFGVTLRSLRLGGGAGHDHELCQLYADILGQPLSRCASAEFGCVGAAVLAAVAAGVHADLAAAVTAMVHVAEVLEPGSGRTVYDGRYARFREACTWLARRGIG